MYLRRNGSTRKTSVQDGTHIPISVFQTFPVTHHNFRGVLTSPPAEPPYIELELQLFLCVHTEPQPVKHCRFHVLGAHIRFQRMLAALVELCIVPFQALQLLCFHPHTVHPVFAVQKLDNATKGIPYSAVIPAGRRGGLGVVH